MSAQILADFDLNLDDLSLGDLIDIERVSGVDLTDRANVKPSLGLVVAFLWVTARRDDPTLTFEQMRAKPLSELEKFAPAPKEAGSAAAPVAVETKPGRSPRSAR